MPFNKSQVTYGALRGIVSERTRRLVVWCGAGLSMPAGLPNWKQLRAALEQALRSKADSLNDDDRRRLEEAAKNIEKFDNYWVAFGMLRKELGETSYQFAIREALKPAATASPPTAYEKLWRLPVAGMLNLNLDRLASRAFTEVHETLVLSEFTSSAVGAHTHLLNRPQPWMYDLHGRAEDANSWVFTHDELKALLGNPAYINIIRSVLSTSTVILVGVRADDIAVGGHLEALSLHGIKTGPHFWITDRTDRRSDRWAEDSGILTVRYDAPEGDHSQLLEALDDLRSYVPPEDDTALPPVVIAAALPPTTLPSPDALLKEDAETIRLLLNRHAKELLVDDSPESIAAYDAFFAKYDEAIHRAWYTSTANGRNKLLGYTLNSLGPQGAFGKVFHASAADGREVAVKVLLDGIRHRPDLLHSFRRGVKSMKILASRGAKGLAAYQDASEIPGMVVMDWIAGANLRDAVAARRLEDWDRLLGTMNGLAAILREAHGVPERVLHRDVRPANVMIENIWEDDNWRVVVLDFDLSWHRGAYEKSVIHGSGTAGYLAPEQIERIEGASTRHSAVDSFGFGMTLFFVLSGRDPIPDQHRHSDWEATVLGAGRRRECRRWRSLPVRIGRLALNCTRDEQDARWDMSQIEGELVRLRFALESPEKVEDADLLAEELAARTDILTDYRWDEDKARAYVRLPSGLSVELRSNEVARELSLTVARTRGGGEDWTKIARWIPKAMESAKEVLVAGGWRIDHFDSDRESLVINATQVLELARKNIDATSALIDRVARTLRA